MRRILPLLIAGGVLLAFIGTLAFLWARSQAPVADVLTESPEERDIIVKTVATGSVSPRHEITIKSAVSGVLAQIVVEPGDILAEGDLIASVRVLPDAASLARAEADVARARLGRAEASRDVTRLRNLAARGAASTVELESAEDALSRAKQEESAARTLLRIVRDGAAGGARVSTDVRTTIAGMVLDVPVEEGTSIIEANTFNEGTSIASVADMDDMVFEGLVDESEVGRIAEGMALAITIGALDDRTFTGALEYIAPKGVEEQGAVQFPIRAALDITEGPFVRAGLSANADIVLDRRVGVLSIREALLQFDEGEPYVEVETAPDTFVKRQVQLGLSDGIWAEVLDGVAIEDTLRVPEGAGARRGGRHP